LCVVGQGHQGKRHSMSQPSGGGKAKPAGEQHAKTPQPTSKSSTQNTSAHPSTSHQPTKSREELIESLHSSRTYLTQANHDYQGHRAKALEEVGNAIKMLSPATSQAKATQAGLASANHAKAANPPASSTPTTSPTKASASPISQATSDEHLAEAKQLLQSVESQMANTGINSHQFMQARSSIQIAIRELNLALVDR
jgi:hypothetical protein